MTGGKGGISSCSCSDWHGWCHGASWWCWCFPKWKCVFSSHKDISIYKSMWNGFTLADMFLETQETSWNGTWSRAISKCGFKKVYTSTIFVSWENLHFQSGETEWPVMGKTTSEGVVKWTNYICDLLHFTCYSVVTVTVSCEIGIFMELVTSRSWISFLGIFFWHANSTDGKKNPACFKSIDRKTHIFFQCKSNKLDI